MSSPRCVTKVWRVWPTSTARSGRAGGPAPRSCWRWYATAGRSGCESPPPTAQAAIVFSLRPARGPMSFTSFMVLTFDVVGTLIDFERGIIDYIRRLSGKEPAELGDEAILESYRRSRSAPGSGWYPDDLVRVYRDMADALGLPRGRGA